MIKFFSKIRFLLNYILPPTTIDLSDGTLKALKGLPDYEKIYLRNNVMTKKGGPKSGHKMQPSRPHKMRGHGRKRLGLKACSPRIRAVAGERQETCTISLRHGTF